jgi:hypothetical protein
MTTRANVTSYLENIQLDELPKPFQEAIAITRELGVRYIWIDSLAIVQDDLADWRREAAKMASIFQGACLVITASLVVDCHSGFDLNDIPPSIQFQCPSSIPGSHSPKLCLRDISEIGARLQPKLNKSPLRKRGWIFQEMMLSRRVGHFVQGQFFGQCRALMQSEDGTYKLTLQRRSAQPDDSYLINIAQHPLLDPEPLLNGQINSGLL